MTLGRSICLGAGGRNRTGTVLPPADFESAASTDFATPAARDRARNYGTVPPPSPRQEGAKCGRPADSCSSTRTSPASSSTWHRPWPAGLGSGGPGHQGTRRARRSLPALCGGASRPGQRTGGGARPRRATGRSRPDRRRPDCRAETVSVGRSRSPDVGGVRFGRRAPIAAVRHPAGVHGGQPRRLGVSGASAGPCERS